MDDVIAPLTNDPVEPMQRRYFFVAGHGQVADVYAAIFYRVRNGAAVTERDHIRMVAGVP